MRTVLLGAVIATVAAFGPATVVVAVAPYLVDGRTQLVSLEPGGADVSFGWPQTWLTQDYSKVVYGEVEPGSTMPVTGAVLSEDLRSDVHPQGLVVDGVVMASFVGLVYALVGTAVVVVRSRPPRASAG